MDNTGFWSRIVLVVGMLGACFLGAQPAAAKQPLSSRHKPATGDAKKFAHASWYGRDFQGKRTAAGSRFDLFRLTAAHRTLQFGSKVRVTEPLSGRSVVVEITDRGPFFHGRDIDLSYAAARKLGIVERGVARVQLEIVQEPEALPPPIGTAMNGPIAWWLPQAIVE